MTTPAQMTGDVQEAGDGGAGVAIAQERPSGRPPPHRRPTDVSRLIVLAPLAAGGVYAAVLLAHLREFLTGVFWNSDTASVPVMAQDLLHHGGHAEVSIATYYTTFLWDFLTGPLPFHHVLAEGFALGCSLAAGVVVAWCVTRVAGRVAGALALVLAVAVSPYLLYASSSLRGPTWLATALLCGVLVLAAHPPARPAGQGQRWVQRAAIGAAGLYAGVSIASDPLVVVTGVLPFAGAGVLSWFLTRRSAGPHVLRATLATSAVAVAACAATYLLTPLVGFRIVGTTHVGLATPGKILPNLHILSHDIRAFGDAYPPTTHLPGVFLVLLPLAMALGTAGAVLLHAARLRRTVPRGPAPREVALLCFLLFWVASAVGDVVGFTGTDLPVWDIGTIRYTVPLFFAMVACLGLWGARSRLPKTAVAALATVLAVVGTVQTVSFLKNLDGGNTAQSAVLASFLSSHGLSKGYGPYWGSLGVTWQSDERVRIYPVFDCGTLARPRMCRFFVNDLSSWYEPEAGTTRTFLVAPPPLFPGIVGLDVRAQAPPDLGPPQEVDTAGAFTIFVYDHDIGPSFPPFRPPA